MKITKVSSKGLALIKKYEGFRANPYLCPANVPTIGYGTTRYPNGKKVALTDSAITEAQATNYLINDIKHFEKSVDALCRDDITQNQFDALVSFAYNLGTTALKNSTLLKRVNNGQLNDVREQFMKWVYANGKPLEGLKKRRKEEADLFIL